MKKQWKNILSLALVLCLLVSAVPVSATAVEETPAARSAEAQSGAQPEAAAPTVTEQEEVTVIREEESLRGEYEKHFLMSDGTYQAVVYSQPVHELVDGVWVEIEAANPNARGDVTTDSTKSNIIDNYVLKGYGVQNKSLDRLYIGNRSAGLTRAYIQFAAMPTIPAGATITAATMTLHFTSGTNTAANASAYQVTGGEWASGTIQWSNKPAANTLLQSNISHNNVTGYVFSCLTAVRHWYDGDTTGQNENYGIMLRYYNESTADYNAVYSADYSDATKRPSLTISYTPPSSTLAVLEGETLALAVSRAASAITWTSSDTAIATVNSSGVVTGIKAGEVTITAFADGSEYQRYTVHVIIQDGVYRIRNNAGLHLGTYGGTTENTSVMLQSYSDSEPYKTCQLWKVSYLGDGYYSIRPMHKLNMGLHAGGTTGSSVDIVSIGMNDSLSEVALINRWGIERSADGSGYYLNHVGTSSLGLKADGIIPSHGMGLTIAQNSGTEVFEWSFLQETGVFMHDIYYEPMDIPNTISKELEMGRTYSTASIGFYMTTSNVDVVWSSDNPNISVDEKGNVTTNNRGVANITASFTIDGVQHTINVKVTSIETVYVKNFYDSTYSGNTEKISKISTAVSFLNLVYYDEFQLKFVMDGSPVRYEYAGIDICPNGVNVCNSTCGSSCKSHHKNVFRIAEELYDSYFDTNHIVVLWSDSFDATYCGSRSDLHFAAIAIALTVTLDEQPSPIVQVFSNVLNNEIESMSINLAHEVAHTLWLKEIYDNAYEDDPIVNGTTWHDDEADRSNMCIMRSYEAYDASELYTQTVDGVASALCDYCIGKLHTEAIQDRDLYES